MDPATKDELLNQAARDYKAFHETLAGLSAMRLKQWRVPSTFTLSCERRSERICSTDAASCTRSVL